MFRSNWRWLSGFMQTKSGTPKRKAPLRRLAVEALEDRVVPANAFHLIDVAQFGGGGFDQARSVAVDGAGNTYVTGYFRGTASFNAGTGMAILTSNGNNDAFVAKLDANGNLVYARQFGGWGNDHGFGVAVDAAGAAYATGSFHGTASFNAGTGMATLVSAGGADAFVAKLDATGNLVYARQFGGTSTDQGYGIAVDAASAAYVTGSFQFTASFNAGAGMAALTSAGNDDAFVAKLDANGNLALARRLGGTSGDVGFGIAVGAAGNTSVVGLFIGTVDFDPDSGTTSRTSAGDPDAFVVKLGDNVVSIAATDAAAAEITSPAAPNPGRFTVTRANQLPLTVAYTVSGTATNGTDYAALSGTVTFAPGATTAIIDVTPINDALSEGNETVIVTLAASDSYELGTASATVTIADNEPEVSVTATDASASEHTAPASADPGQFTVTRTGDMTAALTVNYTISGSASNGTDYTLLSGSVVIPIGSSSAVIDVAPANDGLTEGNETVVLTLAAGAYTIATPTAATVTIADNEPEVSVTATDASAGEDSTNDGRFTITRTGATTTALTVNYTLSGSASNGTDYTLLTGSVVIGVGQSSADIVIDALADADADGGETVVLTIDSGAAYTLATPITGQVVIGDTSSPPSTPPAPAPAPAPPTAAAPPAPPAGTATVGADGTATVFNADGTVRLTATAFAGFAGSLRTALGDANGDGVADVVVATGVGSSHVKVLSGTTGAEIASFLAFDGFTGGVNVGTADIDNDGFADILVGSATGFSHVKVFSGRDGSLLRSFFAFDGFTGGVTVAGGDVNNDRFGDIVVSTASLTGHVKAFSGANNDLLASFLTGDSGGLYLGVGDLDGDLRADILTGTARRASVVRLYSGATSRQIAEFRPFGAFDGGVFVAVTDRDGNGDREITVGAGPGAGPHVKVYAFPELTELGSFFASADGFTGGVPVG